MQISKPKISIFIPTHNDQIDLSACLESLRNLDYPKEMSEIVVWDNGSQDDTLVMVRELYGQMKEEGWLNLCLLESDKNEGTYVPYNLALPQLSSQTEYILGLDADVELASDVVTRLVNAAQGERVAVVGARSVYFDNSELTSNGAGFVSRWAARYDGSDPSQKIECDYVIGCCLLLNKKIFMELGCFDPDYYISQWEVDYCLRAKEKGYRIIYEPKAIAKHKIPIKATPSSERIYYLFRNKLLMARKNQALFRFPGTVFLCFGLSLARIVFSLAWTIPWASTKSALAGLRDGLLQKSGKRGN
jgi:GT2 family glycosyltransferase